LDLSTYSDLTSSARNRTEQTLSELVPKAPLSLYDPVRFILSAGGKRVRATLTYLTSQLASAEEDYTFAASAVELLHTFTLIHDDIMDNATTRRGNPTVHIKYSSNEAILSGDVMIALALEALSRGNYKNYRQMGEEFWKGFRFVCEGQALDKEFETRSDITEADYIHMIDLKTAKVTELAGVLGALISNIDFVEPVRSFAHHTGIAFQILDDLLDLTAEHPSFGKTIGGDILEGKRTYLFVKAFEQYAMLPPVNQALLDRIVTRTASVDDIPKARQLFEQMGVLQQAKERSEHETMLAKAALSLLPESEAKEMLSFFSDQLLGRVS